MARVLVVLARDNFRDCEYLVPLAFFKQAGFEVFSVSEDYFSKGKFGYNVENNFTYETDFDEICEFEFIYLVAEEGFNGEIQNDDLKNLINNFRKNHKLIGSNFNFGDVNFNYLDDVERFSLSFINLIKN